MSILIEFGPVVLEKNFKEKVIIMDMGRRFIDPWKIIS